MITLDPNSINRVDPRSRKVIEQEKKEEEKRRAEEIIQKQKKKLKMRLKNKAKHDLILKDFNRNQALRGKIKAMITMKNKKKDEEKSKVRKEVKILKNLAEDFDPELYIKEKEEEEDNISYENEEVSDE